MPSFSRREIVDQDQVGIYHCIARCVRRAFLCGADPVSGKSFEHRKDWVRDRLEELAAHGDLQPTVANISTNAVIRYFIDSPYWRGREPMGRPTMPGLNVCASDVIGRRDTTRFFGKSSKTPS